MKFKNDYLNVDNKNIVIGDDVTLSDVTLNTSESSNIVIGSGNVLNGVVIGSGVNKIKIKNKNNLFLKLKEFYLILIRKL